MFPKSLVEESTRQEILYPVIDRLSDGMIVETGTFCGGNILRMADRAKQAGKLIQFYASDNFLLENISGEAMVDIPSGDYFDNFWQNVKSCNLEDYIIAVRGDSRLAASKFSDNSVDLVFLDSSHVREYVLEEIRAWLPKIKVGGVCSGHDYPDLQVRASVFDVFDRDIVKQSSCGSSWWVQL